jgi:membrane-associated phospholipid phosphatase
MSFELKNIIKQPRPKNIKPLDGNYGNKYKYGMPSYHSQLTFFSITFLYLLYGNKSLLIIELLIGCITIYQAYSYNRHTLEQLFGGAFIGIITGYLGVAIIKKIYY